MYHSISDPPLTWISFIESTQINRESSPQAKGPERQVECRRMNRVQFPAYVFGKVLEYDDMSQSVEAAVG